MVATLTKELDRLADSLERVARAARTQPATNVDERLSDAILRAQMPRTIDALKLHLR